MDAKKLQADGSSINGPLCSKVQVDPDKDTLLRLKGKDPECMGRTVENDGGQRHSAQL